MVGNLIVTCDDAGLSAGINEAIATGAQKNRITTASIIANFAYLQSACERLPGLGVACGVHLNINDGQPLSDVDPASGLVTPAGRFRTRQGLLIRALWPSRRFLDAVEREFVAQIEAVVAGGVTPTHITSHLHFQIVPSLQRLVEKLSRRYGVIWMRNHQVQHLVVPHNIFLKRRAVCPNKTGAPYSLDYLVDLRLWMNAVTPEELVREITTLQGNVELVVHPSLEPDATYPLDLPNRPEQRHQQWQYFERFIEVFLYTQTNFLLQDPALTR